MPSNRSPGKRGSTNTPRLSWPVKGLTNSMNSKVDNYLDGLEKWQKEALHLREVLLDCGLDEEFKWKIPVYAYQGGNIVAVNPLKECIALGFFKGALMLDASGIF